MAFSSVRVQLTIWNVAILALILVVCGAALRYRMQSGLMAAVDRDLVGAAQSIPMPPGGGKGGPPPQDDGPGGPPQGFEPGQGGGFRAGMPPPGNPGFPPGRPNGGMPFMPPEMQGNPPGPAPSSAADNQRGLPPGFQDNNRSFPDGPDPRRMPRRPRRSSADIRILQPNGIDPDPQVGGLPFDNDAFSTGLAGTTAFTISRHGGVRWRVYTQPLRDRSGNVRSVVQTRQSLAPVDSEVADLTRTLLTLIPVGLLAAALGGAFLTGRSLRPVQAIATAVDRIQAEELSRRLPVAGHDEFARLTTTLNAMLGRLQSAFEEQRRFTMDASHELKTPLTVIKAKTSVALTKPREAEAYRSTLETVDQAADRMTKIVQDLLLLAQADSGQLGDQRQPASVRQIIQTALDATWVENGPAVTIEMPEPGPTVTGNVDELVRAFRNLIENAKQHTPPTGTVTISAREREGGVEVSVLDTGEGIAPEHLARLCDRFYRVDTARSRDQGGTGLGLAICKGIIDAHHGRVAFESAVGVGTTVRVWLPG